MKLAIAIYTGPIHEHTDTAMNLAREARRKGHDVTIFGMFAGVLNLGRDDFNALVNDGIKITVCEHNRAEFKAPANVEGIHYGSQFDLSGYANEADHFVSFTY